MDDDLFVFIGGMFIGFILCMVLVSIVLVTKPQRIDTEESCVIEVADARNPNEVCTLWIEDGKTVVGPTWLKGEG